LIYLSITLNFFMILPIVIEGDMTRFQFLEPKIFIRKHSVEPFGVHCIMCSMTNEAILIAALQKKKSFHVLVAYPRAWPEEAQIMPRTAKNSNNEQDLDF